MIGLALQAARSAKRLRSTERTVGIADSFRSGIRKVVHIPVNITRNEQIEAAIAVVITKARTCGPITESYASLFGHIRKCAVMIVVIKTVLSIIGHIEIRPAVVVIVTHSHTKAPAVIGHTGLRSYLGKCSVVVVVKERSMGRFFLAVESVLR